MVIVILNKFNKFNSDYKNKIIQIQLGNVSLLINMEYLVFFSCVKYIQAFPCHQGLISRSLQALFQVDKFLVYVNMLNILLLSHYGTAMYPLVLELLVKSVHINFSFKWLFKIVFTALLGT